MRINFNGTFREVSKLLTASNEAANARPNAPEFAEALAQLAPQSTEITTKTAPSPVSIPTSSESLMGRLKFEPPSSRPPILEPFSGQILVEEAVKEAPKGVKTPAVLEVRRLNSLDGLKPSERQAKVGELVSKAGIETGIDPALAMAVAKAESGFNAKAVSSDGHASKGLFQLLDGTGKELHAESGLKAKYDPFDPHQNTNLGVRYLRRLHEIFSQNTKLPNDSESVVAANSSSLEKLAVAAFNAGEGRVASAQSRAKAAGLNAGLYEEIESYLPKTTQEYVGRVMQFKTEFEREDIG